MNLRAVAALLGRLLGILAASQVLPLLWSLRFVEMDAALAFLISGGLAGATGLVLHRMAQPHTQELYRREGILIVVGGWFLASLFGALPYLLSGEIPDFAGALFESASGFTTTGASVLTDIEAMGRGMLFWRSLTQWLGGLGIIVLFVALLSELGPGARFLYRLEMPGPTAEVLQPRVRESAVALWKIYLTLTLGETVLLVFAGLGPYDALTHSLSTLSTGGFSPRAASIAAFDSALVEIIVIVFMVLAGANFSLYYTLRHGRFNLCRDREFTVYIVLLAASSGIIAWKLVRMNQITDPLEALRTSAFQVVSLATTTGFASADFDRWPDSARALLLGLMVIGGCAGSTAGGLKVMRALVGFKAAVREARIIFSPNAVLPVSVGGAIVPNSVCSSVAGFLILYFFTLLLGSLLLTLGGSDLLTAASATVACLGNVGPGIADVGPVENFARFAAWEKLFLVLLMWLGRLEILAIAALTSAAFWRR